MSEKDTFLDAMDGVKPISGDNRVLLKHQPPALAQQLKRQALERSSKAAELGLSLELREELDPFAPLTYKKDGVQDGVFRNLRLGKYQIDNRLNLPKGAPEKAMEKLAEELSLNFRYGIRTLLIQHGKGLSSNRLRSFLNQWLPEFPFVLAFHSALPAHGGLAATYVLLKKNPEEKLRNKEIQRKGG